MKKFPVVIKWTVEKVVFVEANTEAGALDKAENEPLEDGEAVLELKKCHVLIALD